MTVGELIELLECIDEDVVIESAEGKEFSHISLFHSLRRTYICLEVE